MAVLMCRAMGNDCKGEPYRRPALEAVLDSPLAVTTSAAPGLLDTCSCDHVDASLPNATCLRAAVLIPVLLPAFLNILATISPAIIVLLCAPPGAIVFLRRRKVYRNV